MRKKIFPFFLFFFFLCPPVLAANYDFEMPLLTGQESATSLSQYVKMVFIYGLGLVGAVALFGVVYSGFNYLISGSSDTRKSESKKGIWAALSGLGLILLSFAILYTINPQLTSLKEPGMNPVSVGGTTNFDNINGTYNLEMPLGQGINPADPGSYIKTFFIYGLALVGIAAFFGVVYGGFMYFISAGNESLKTYGRKWIVAALSGLALLICSYAILYTINPQLTSLQLKQPDPVGINGNQAANFDSSAGTYNLEMPLPGSGQTAPTDLGQYIKNIFLFGLAAAGLTALFAVAYGGIVYLLSAGSAPMQTHAKQWIFSAISGIVLLVCSYAILYTINPQLITLKIDQLKQVAINGATDFDTATGTYKLEMPLGGNQPNQTPGDYVRTFFIYGLGIAGLAALFGLVYGGLNYVVSAGSETRKTEGKQWIIGALSGLVLLLCSYLILATINTQTLSFQNPKLDTVTIEPHAGLTFSQQQIPQIYAQIKGDYGDAINKYASQFNVSPNLIYGVMMAESGGNQNATGPQTNYGTAKGLMQLIDSTATGLGVTNSYDPDQNIRGGTQFLGQMLAKYNGNTNLALAAYNWGPGNLNKVNNDINRVPETTKAYINNVRKYGGL